MLVTPPDPQHRLGARDAPQSVHDAGHAAAGGHRVTRLMTGLQMIGSLLAIPIGLVSGYSIYHANFSVTATCQGLRANIISMIDTKVDAATRRMLVRHDVEAFEKSCGAFDPDAEAAFKRLLTVETKPAPTVAAVSRAEAPTRESTRRVELRPARAAKPLAATAVPTTAKAEPMPRDHAGSDAKWLAEVRRVLLAHSADQPQPRDVAAPAVPPPGPVAVSPVIAKIRLPASPARSDVPMTAPAPMAPATTAVAAPAKAAVPDHPVPPAPIPDVAASPGG
jgi:hypothetical protein